MSDTDTTEFPALLKNVQEMLNEEKWTRAALSNYSTSQFKELDLILVKAREEKLFDGLKKLCEEHLINTKNSIIGLYLAGMISLSRQIIDDSALISLVTIFADNHKINIVKYLCERILDYGESKFALRTLGELYKTDEDEALYNIWERLVKIDYEEADLAKALGDHYEKSNDLKNAIDYYKKALHRYITKQSFANIKEVWEKLLQYCPEDLDFFFHVQKRIAKVISEDKAVILLRDVYDICLKNNGFDTAIIILKMILEYDDDDKQARRDITDCYRKKYADHSQLEEYIRVSNLSQNWRNVHEAIIDFEKHIAFDKGSFVFHRTWGVGRIAGVKGDDIVIDFSKKPHHSMSLKMAVNALQTLAKNHIWVLKATYKKEKLREKVKGDIIWTLKTIIRSFGNSCDIKRIKAELSPAILTASEWNTWNTKAREILKTDPGFGINSDNADLFTVRDRPISIEEKLYSEFKAERNFFNRTQIIRSFISQKDTELDSEYFSEMFSYFAGYLKSYNVVNEQVVASYLLVKELVNQHPHLGSGIKLDFYELFEHIEDPIQLFLHLKDIKLKEDFLRQVKLFVPEWHNVYLKLFPRYPLLSIIENLRREGFLEKLTSLTLSCFDNYRDNRDAVVWLFKNMNQESWYRDAAIPLEKQIITLIHVLDISYREIENRRDTAENRKLNKQVYNILFKDGDRKDGILFDLIDKTDMDNVVRIFTFINEVKDLDPADKMAFKKHILKRYPDIKFFRDEEEKKVVTLGLIVTQEKYIEKQKLLAKIINEDLPANAKELEYAKSLGDLSENAEYKAALERQSILNAMLERLSEDLEKAKLFDPRTVNTSRVSFGTKVMLVNQGSGVKEEYTILGPWESDPDNRVISYLSPFGAAILNKAPGEQADFVTGSEKGKIGDKISFIIESITTAI